MARTNNLVECWNCGKTYDLDDHERCPDCSKYYSENNPIDDDLYFNSDWELDD